VIVTVTPNWPDPRVKKVPGGVPAGVRVLPGAGVGAVRAIVEAVGVGVGLESLSLHEDVSPAMTATQTAENPMARADIQPKS
jgi:hypothetical protein